MVSTRDAGAPVDAGRPDAGAAMDAGLAPVDAGPTIASFDVIYVQTSERLYTYAPPTGALVDVAGFTCRSVTDMAIDRQGRAFVVNFAGLYRLDVSTGACLRIADVPEPLVALTFLPAGLLDPTSEVLVGYGQLAYWKFDPVDGSSTRLGSSTLMRGLEVSGDLTSLSDGGTFLSVRQGMAGTALNDLLVRIDPRTGQILEEFAQLPANSVWGLATWDDEIFGFSARGQGLRLSPATGSRPTLLQFPAGFAFWGAAARPGAGPGRDAGP